MTSATLFAICIALPFAGACLLPIAGHFMPRVRNLLALLLVLLLFLGSAFLLGLALRDGALVLSLELPLGLSFAFTADAFSAFMAALGAFMTALVLFYSFGYIERYAFQNEYYILMVLLAGCFNAVLYAGTLLLIYIFLQMAVLCYWRLTVFYRDPVHIGNANRNLMLLTVGSLAFLLGVIGLYVQNGTFSLAQLQGLELSGGLLSLLMFGLFMVTAIFPLHDWLTNSIFAPTSAAALINGVVMLNLGLCLFARLFVFTFVLDELWQNAIPVVAVISSLFAAGAALAEQNLKRMLSYAAISQAGFILMGLASSTTLAFEGAFLYIFIHSLAITGLFLCVGSIERAVHSFDIRRMGGLWSRMPLVGVCFLLCALSLTGLPPMPGFYAKYMLIAGAANSGHSVIALLFGVSSFLSILYLLRAFFRIFFGKQRGLATQGAMLYEGSWEMIFAISAFTFFLVLAGLFINIPSYVVDVITSVMGR